MAKWAKLFEKIYDFFMTIFAVMLAIVIFVAIPAACLYIAITSLIDSYLANNYVLSIGYILLIAVNIVYVAIIIETVRKEFKEL